MLALRHRRQVAARQPTQALSIDWGNPITRGLVFASVGGVPVDLAGQRMASQRIAGIGMGLPGRCDVFTSDAMQVTVPMVRAPMPGACTILSIADWTSGYAQLLGQHALDDTWYGANLYVESNSALNFARARGDGVIAFREADLTGVPAGLGTFAATHVGDAPTAAKLYLNGAQISSLTVNTEVFSTSTQPMRVGAYGTGATPSFESYLSLAFERVLTLREIRALTFGIGNPWQVFRPMRRAVFRAMGSTGIPTLSAATVVMPTATTATPRVTITF